MKRAHGYRIADFGCVTGGAAHEYLWFASAQVGLEDDMLP